jgi:hypothetical protein
MKLQRASIVVVAAVAIVFLASPRAQAQMYGGYAGGWYGGLPYSVYSLDSVPYYALHPPVYYSHVVPRPYGYSPYAYPPYVMTPERTPETPQTMVNPHVPASPASNSEPKPRVAHVEPKTVFNPYVNSEAVDAPTVVRHRGRPAPKTVHPAAMARGASGQSAG